VWRQERELFDGTEEHRLKPEKMSRDQLLQQLIHVENVQFEKYSGNKRKHRRSGVDINESNWRKKCIFFKLPYWSILKLRHNLDIMHTKKNIYDSILGTLINILGKIKDTANVKRDLYKMGMYKKLHLQTNGTTTTMPLVVYTLAIDEKNSLCEWLKCVKFFNGYTSNIGQYVNKLSDRISGMKSHDCHVFLQYLLLVAICEKLTPEIETTLIEIDNFFK
jgi:hypothetical protein